MMHVHCSGGWTISGLDLHDPRLLAIAEAERRYLESEYVEYTASNASGAAFCRSAALIVSIKASRQISNKRQLPLACDNPKHTFLSQLMALLLLRHALTITDDADGEEDDPSSILSVSGLKLFLFCILDSEQFMCKSIESSNTKTTKSSDSYCSLSCSELLDFFFHAISWLGPSVFYNGEDKDRLV